MQYNFLTNVETIKRSCRPLTQTSGFFRSAVVAMFAVFICCTTSYGQIQERAMRTPVRRQTVMRPTFNSNYDNYSKTGSSLNVGSRPTLPAVVNPFERFQGEVSPIESDMIQDAKDNRFDRYSLFEAALIAAGNTDAAKLEDYKRQYNNRVYQLSQLIPQNASELQKARIILEYLHREMFREYLLESSNIGAIFDSGIYNCVTGATLFNSLARQFGVRAVALELPGHAMSRVYLSDGSYYDVETTCAVWFQLQDYPGKQEQVIARMLEAGAASQVVDAPVVRRPINDVELVAKLYYNRGVEALNKENFAGAMHCNAKALVLDSKSATAKGNFLATLNNWAINESKDAHYDYAMRILRQGMKIDPNYPIFKNNHVHIYHQWIEQLCKESRYEEAVALSRQAMAEAPNEEHFRKLEAYALMGVQRMAAARASAAQPSEPVTTTVGYPHQ
ncbi:MAG: hypothetical protein IJQ39_06805 [Thermoguttaceae bacterium]|nr:hypothetical protein [Thermoguttaceae bacterium]